MDRCDLHPSADYAPDHANGCSAGHGHDHHARGHDHGRDCSRDRAREFHGSSVLLLRDKVAGDYLAIGGDVHAPTEQ